MKTTDVMKLVITDQLFTSRIHYVFPEESLMTIMSSTVRSEAASE